jgi:hypothetical protein
MSAESRSTAERAAAEPHDTRVVVWDVPSASGCGAAFSVRVGVKCALGCCARGWIVEIRDRDGQMLASARTSEAPWPGTAALYHAEVGLRAPATAGLHPLEAHVAAVAGEIEHGAGSAHFDVRSVPTPECRLTVIAVDAASQAPVAGAKVVIHPYRGSTDERGVAELGVAKGTYRLFVSRRDYLPFRFDGRVDADLTIRAELDVDVGPGVAELWP